MCTDESVTAYLYILPALPRCRNLEHRQPPPIVVKDPRLPRLRWLLAFRMWLTLSHVWSGCTAVVAQATCYLLCVAGASYLAGVSKQEACPGLISPPRHLPPFPTPGCMDIVTLGFPICLVYKVVISEIPCTTSCRWRMN
jgi:hypothetical protein